MVSEGPGALAVQATIGNTTRNTAAAHRTAIARPQTDSEGRLVVTPCRIVRREQGNRSTGKVATSLTVDRLASAIRTDWGTEAVDKDWVIRPVEMGLAIEPAEATAPIASEAAISLGAVPELAREEAHSVAEAVDSTGRARAAAERAAHRVCVAAAVELEAVADGADRTREMDWR